MRRPWMAALAAGLILAGCTSAADGANGADPAPAPSVAPTWVPGTVVPTVATCAARSTRDDTEVAEGLWLSSAPGAVDSQSGRLVVVSASGGFGMAVRTASLDVCTNTWQVHEFAPWAHVGWGGPAVVYDPGTDALLVLTVSQTGPTRSSTYSPTTHLWAETVLPQKLLPWAYSVDSDQWAMLPSIEFPPGLESASLTHAALDPASGQVLFLMEDAGSRTLWSYNPGWRTLTQLGGQAPAGRSGDPTLLLDARARRLVLILWGSPIGVPGETWTFDLLSRRWIDQLARPPDPAWVEPSLLMADSGAVAAFDPVSQQTFALIDGQLSSYRTGADRWNPVYRGPGWPSLLRLTSDEDPGLTGPLARTGHSLAYDPVNRRILVYGGTWRSAGGERQHGDVWAYDVPTNTWTELVPPTPAQ
jgi:Galactose oxidase, central domain